MQMEKDGQGEIRRRKGERLRSCRGEDEAAKGGMGAAPPELLPPALSCFSFWTTSTSNFAVTMAPARKRRARPSTDTSIDLLNHMSKASPITRRHTTARYDKVWDIPESPEARSPPRKPPRKSEPIQPYSKPRTRQNKGTPTPEPAESPDPAESPEPDHELVVTEDAERLSPDATGSQSPELVLIEEEEDTEERIDSDNSQIGESDEAIEHSEGVQSDRGEDLEKDHEPFTIDTDDFQQQNSAEYIRHPDPAEEGSDGSSSHYAEANDQLVPLQSNVEVVIDNVPDSSYLSRYLSRENAETNHDADYQELEPHGQSAEPEVQLPSPQKPINANTRFLRDLRQWFDREVEMTGVGHDWKKLNERGLSLKYLASSPRPQYLDYLHEFFAEYRRLYREAVEPEDLTEVLWIQLKNIKESIVAEVKELFGHASEELQDSNVLDQFEAHFIPKMIILTQIGFKMYRTTNGQAHGQLQHTLNLLSICINLVKGYKLLLGPAFRSRTLVQPLQRVIKALETNQLRNNWLNPNNGYGNSHWTEIPAVVDNWSLNEERVLRHALVRYVDYGQYTSEYPSDFIFLTLSAENPFLLTVRHFGHKLPGRSIRDLQGKARAMGLI